MGASEQVRTDHSSFQSVRRIDSFSELTFDCDTVCVLELLDFFITPICGSLALFVNLFDDFTLFPRWGHIPVIRVCILEIIFKIVFRRTPVAPAEECGSDENTKSQHAARFAKVSQGT